MDTQRETTRPRSALARCLILACALVAIYAVGPAAGAHAGNYEVIECTGGSFPAAPDAVFSSNSTAYSGGSACGGDPGLSLQIGGGVFASNGEYAMWRFAAPSGTLIRGAAFQWRGDWTWANYPYVRLLDATGSAQAQWNPPPGGESVCGTAFCNGLTSTTKSGSYLDLVLLCNNPGYSCYLGGGGSGNLKNLDMTVEDVAPPAKPVLGGSLVAGGPKRGTESLSARASDSGSGITDAEVYVNGGRIDVQTRCAPGPAVNSFTPCPASTVFSFDVRTDVGPFHDGTNSLSVCTHDFASATTARLQSCTDTTVSVDNSCDDSVGTTVGSNLDAGLALGNEQPKVNMTVTSNDRVVVKGTVTGPSGAVPGASVCIYEQVSGSGDAKALADVVHTKSNGSFTSRLDPGPSRDVYVDYRHSNLLLEKQLNLGSATSPTLKIAKRRIRNGHSMKYKGTIPGPDNAGRGVTIQARVGKSWRTFAQVTTDTVGEFKGRYKFKNSTLPRAKYTFRALVKQQSGYPFMEGSSNKATVIVKG